MKLSRFSRSKNKNSSTDIIPYELRNKKKSFWQEAVRDKWLYILFLPTFIWFIMFAYVPMLGNVIAFYDFNIFQGLEGSDFAGLRHFRVLFTDPYFARLFRNTLLINVFGLIFGFPLPIILAVALNEIKNKRFKKVSQTISYLPYFLSAVVVMSIAKYFVATDGPINLIASWFGAEPTNFLIHAEYFRTIFTTTNIWQNTGFSSIIYLAALTNIPTEQYEASDIDGANKFQKLWFITLPNLIPVISIQLLLSLGSIMSVGHEKIILIYNASIYETADVFNTYVYREGLRANRYSYAQAVSMFQSVVGLILVFSSNKIVQKLDGTSLW